MSSSRRSCAVLRADLPGCASLGALDPRKSCHREMPPWHADPHVGQWANDSHLSQQEIDKISAWVAAGAPEGNSKLPPVPQFAQGWRIGQPDLVVSMLETFKLEASGPDEYQYFEVDPGFKQDMYVQQAESRPGNRRIVHHIIVFIKPPVKEAPKPLSKEEKEAKERASISYQEGFLVRTKADAPVYDNGCELPNGGTGKRLDGKDDTGNIVWLSIYAPGTQPYRLPQGTAIKVPAGSTLRFQVHYSKVTGIAEQDRSSVGLIFANQPPQKELLMRAVANSYFRIPAGALDHPASACWTVPEDINLLSIMPHMHMRGKSQRVEAIYPDGRHEVVLNVPRYEFGWQTVYEAARQKMMPKGTKIIVTSTFDNSPRNKYNPDATKAIRWGEPTYDEMLIAFINYTRASKPSSVAQRTSPAISKNSGANRLSR